MNIWGKVLLGIVALLWIGGLVLSGQFLAVRNSWLKVIRANEEKIKKQDEDLKVARLLLIQTEAEYQRVMLSWDRAFQPVETQVAQGALVLQLGAAELPAGDGAQPVVFAFQPGADGASSEFVGEFKATRLDDAARPQSTFRLNRRPRPNESAGWRAGPNWRVRTFIPAQHIARLSDLDVQLLQVDERLATVTAELKRQEEQLALVQKLLENRVTEIEGSDELRARAEELPTEVALGVVATIAQEEEERNAALIEADRLRRELRTTTLKFEATSAGNEKLARSLPGQEVTATEANARP